MKEFFRKWMLPLAMTVGVLAYLLVHYLWRAAESPYMAFCGNVQPVLIGLMLFLQLNLVAPSDLPLPLRRGWWPIYRSCTWAAPWVWRAIKLKRRLLSR